MDLITPEDVINKSDEKVDETYVEGSEAIPLPSKGLFYLAQYRHLEKLRVRQLNYTDEDILTTQSYIQDGSVFNELLKNVIVDKNGFSANNLIPIDRDTILLWLRSTAFGNIFEAETTCPSCKEKNNISWDISKFQIPEYPKEIFDELEKYGEYSLVTPLSQTIIKITIPSIGKSKEYEKSLAVKKQKLGIKSDLNGTGSLMLIVSGVEVDGKIIRNKSEIESYFNKINLAISDARYIKKQFEKINLKYDTSQTVTCDKCKYVQEGVEMPLLHPNFFWVS